MLKHRLLYGSLMIALLVGLLWVDSALDRVVLTGTPFESVFGRGYLPAGLLLLAILLTMVWFAGRELSNIFQRKGIETRTRYIFLPGAVGMLLMYATPQDVSARLALAIFATCLAATFIFTIVLYSHRERTQGAIAVAATTTFAFVYLGAMPGFYMALRRWHTPWLIVALFLIVKSCDIGAYFTGRLLGRHKLIPWLSPGKTWEGLIGGMIFSGLVAVACVMVSNAADMLGHYELMGYEREWVADEVPLWFAFVSGLILGVVGQFGDLTASLFKRDAGIKDSGTTIPGFGGLLDVVDSPIVAAPIAYWLVMAAMEFPE